MVMSRNFRQNTRFVWGHPVVLSNTNIK